MNVNRRLVAYDFVNRESFQDVLRGRVYAVGNDVCTAPVYAYVATRRCIYARSVGGHVVCHPALVPI